MVRVTGASLGLLAFAVTITAGLLVGNPTTTILARALWAMASFFLLGCVLGYVAQRVIDEHAIRRHRELFGESSNGGGKDSSPGPWTSAKSGGVQAADGDTKEAVPGGVTRSAERPAGQGAALGA